MGNKRTINYTVKNHLCTGCGICEGACPTNSISVFSDGQGWKPCIDSTTCINEKGCQRCYLACPGVGINLTGMASDLFGQQKYDQRVGRYNCCFTGYSTDYDIRYHSASGGMVSRFLIYLLENKLINGAVVTKFDRENEFLVNSFIARSKEDILSAKSSIYGPVSFHKVVKEVKESEGKMVIVGLPCHIQGFRKLEKTDKKFKSKVEGYFALYCSAGRTFYLTEYVFKVNKIDKNKLTYFAYRDEGCLGNMLAKWEDKEFRSDYQDYYHPLRSFFIPKRCTTCIDHFGELGDVSFGDIHYGHFKEDKIGTSSLIIRNPKFLGLLQQAKKDNFIVLDDLDVQTVIKSQVVINQKKGKNATVMKIDSLLGRKVPEYDVKIVDKSPLKTCLFYLHTAVQRAIGRNKSLWFLIPLLRRRNVKK